MFEPIFDFDPARNKTLYATLRKPIRARDVAIFQAYDRITSTYKDMLRKHISRKKQQFVDWDKWQITTPNLFKEFVCQFCSIKLTLTQDEYFITLTVPISAFQSGTGLNTNALLRVAFEHTKNESGKPAIENCLNIVLTYNAEEYFDRKADEYEEQAAVWFNRKQ